MSVPDFEPLSIQKFGHLHAGSVENERSISKIIVCKYIQQESKETFRSCNMEG
jgi:hypothetical protein